MAEGQESLFGVVGTDTALTYSPKRKMGIGEVHDHIVDASATVQKRVHHLVLMLLVVAEKIESQRMLSTCYEGEGLLEGVVTDQGEDGAEDLFCHQGRIEFGVGDDRRGYAQRLGVDLSPEGKRTHAKE